jgi:hypothetical protein
MRRALISVLSACALTGIAVPALASAPDLPDPTVPAARDAEPVVMTGASFPKWAAPAELTAKVPSLAGGQCTNGDNTCTHNTYEKPEVATGDALGKGAAVDKLLGYRWSEHAHKFIQIPFQVDEMATRYLSNNASTFSFYSETDQHPTYVFDEERFRWTKEDPADPCHAVADGLTKTTPDPVPGLDTNDEVSFMASDGGPQAPSGADLPRGVAGAYRVELRDPLVPTRTSYVYVMLAGDGKGAPKPAFDASNGYVRYLPDADSDTFLYSQSAYGSYGNAPKGAWFDPATGTCVTDRPKQHRPKDTAWVKTPRYEFRYDGRWVLDDVRVAPKNADNPPDAVDPSTWQYGPDIVDRWKARAFQQRPGGTTPCCGYEEEQNNWGGSSVLMGWRAGPVRVIRSTWGSDSSTNNVRTDYFYRDQFRMNDDLRVHPVPPADGIYTQWDFNAGKVSTYYNAYKPGGVPADGKNDEVFGNDYLHVASDGLRLQDGDPVPVVGPLDVGTPGAQSGRCGASGKACIDNDVDLPDPTHSGPLGTLSYEEVTGPNGTWVDRWTVHQVTGGTAYGLVTVPYYRDDSCFDDGTGDDPGPHLNARAPDPIVPTRTCWDANNATAPAPPTPTYYQGDIATHGLHIEVIADSDNAFTTQPVDEIDGEQIITLLPGQLGNVGEQYGRSFEKPLVPLAVPFAPSS